MNSATTKAPILMDAHEIVSGAWCPWLEYRYIASREDWLFYAQCALDGDESDLVHLLAEWAVADEENGRLNLPDPEDWRDEPGFLNLVPAMPVMRSAA